MAPVALLILAVICAVVSALIQWTFLDWQHPIAWLTLGVGFWWASSLPWGTWVKR
jgi:hypothetical protein